MFRIDAYIDKLITLLKDVFGERLMYIGLQGSYLCDEETKNSDIDIMAVIDMLSVEEIFNDFLTKLHTKENRSLKG